MSLLKIGEKKNLHNHRIQMDVNAVNEPSYVFSGSVNTDIYNDITSNTSWMSVGKYHYDFLFCRNQVMMWTPNYVNKEGQTGWSGLTLEEKQIAAKVFAVGATERSEVYTDSELQAYWGEFLVNSEKARRKRWEAAKSYISYVLPMVDSIDLGKTTTDLSHQYITYGVESYSADGVDGLFDWVENTSSYSGDTGFSGKTYYTTTHKDKMMEILRDGIY
jgi:hypothetical protein